MLIDCWYAGKEHMLCIESLGKVYYCPLKTNRFVGDSNGTRPYQRVDNLEQSNTQQKCDMRSKIERFHREANNSRKLKEPMTFRRYYSKTHHLCFLEWIFLMKKA